MQEGKGDLVEQGLQTKGKKAIQVGANMMNWYSVLRCYETKPSTLV